MKKNLLFILMIACSLVLTTAAQAQIGIKGGVTLSNIAQEAFEDNADDFKDNSTIGFQGGIFAELPIGDVFAIQPELLFVQKGGKSEFNIGSVGYERNFHYNYIEVPVLAKVKAGSTDGSGIGLFFYGGPFVSYALNGKIDTKIASAETERDIEFNDEDDQRRLDWGAAFGLGVNLGALTLDLRYDLGINNLLTDEFDGGGDNGDNPYLRTRSIGLTLGFVLGGGN